MLLDDYIVATPAQRMVIAPWTLGTHVFDQFECFPRFGLISPTRGFGKTTLFKLLDQLASETKLSKNATPAAIYRRLEHRPRTTYLLDEAENQGLLADRVLRGSPRWRLRARQRDEHDRDLGHERYGMKSLAALYRGSL